MQARFPSRFAVADSAYNESELLALGYEGTAVVPLLIDMHAKSDDPDPDQNVRVGDRVDSAPDRAPEGRSPTAWPTRSRYAMLHDGDRVDLARTAVDSRASPHSLDFEYGGRAASTAFSSAS